MVRARGQEPRPRRHRGRPVATTTVVLDELRADGALVADDPAPPGPRRLRPHRGLRRGHRRLVRRVAAPASCPTPDRCPPRCTCRPRGPGAALRREPPPGRGPLLALAASRAGGTPPSSTAARRCRYLNVYDAEAAWRLVHVARRRPAAVVIKHANPCGAAVADDITTAYTRAHECDPVSAFGGIVAREPHRAPGAGRGPRTGVHRGAHRPRLRRRRPGGAAGEEEPAGPDRAPAPACRSWTCARSTAGCWSRPADHGDASTGRRGRWSPSGRPPTRSGPTWSWPGGWSARVTSNTIVLVKDGQAVGIGCRPAEPPRRRAPSPAEKADGRAVGGAYAVRRLLPVPRRPRRGGVEAGADRGHPARRLDPRRRGHRRGRRARAWPWSSPANATSSTEASSTEARARAGRGLSPGGWRRPTGGGAGTTGRGASHERPGRPPAAHR